MRKTPDVFPIMGGRNIEHLKGNIEALTLELSEEDTKEIEETNAFDIGFPQKFLGGPTGVHGPGDVWLTKMGGDHQFMEWPKPIKPIKK